jgi:4-amino-4-deoxy-L-arabinose transferase-like glycosyltransferase
MRYIRPPRVTSGRLLPLSLALTVLVFGYLSRWIFFYKFDPVYWENAYYESQWNIPNSPRGIGDDGLYRYIGYRLVNNKENPFNVNYEVPPLGKYTYGLSAKYLGNPFFTTFLYYLGSIFLFFQISKHFFPSKLAWLATILYACNPMIVNEIQNTMLDLPLTFFFLLFIYYFTRYLDNKTTKSLFLSAISLGLMAGVKSPFFIPMIATVSSVFIVKSGQIKKVPIFLSLIFVGYMISYFCYFIRHPNPIPWLRLHEKIYLFMKNNGSTHDWFSVLRFMLTNEYRGFWVNAKSYWPTNWSIIYPLGLVSLIFGLFKYFRRKPIPEWLSFFVIVTTCYLVLNLTIDFWPRYLVPITPILVLIISYFLRKHRVLLVIIMLTYLPYLFMFFFPKPTEFKELFDRLYKSNYYKDTYQLLDSSTRNKLDVNTWQRLSAKTPLSSENFEIIKEQNQWRIHLLNK